MKKYTIILTNKKEHGLTYTKNIERLTFAEAASAAYMMRQNLGYDWRITNVRETFEKLSQEPRKTLGEFITLA